MWVGAEKRAFKSNKETAMKLRKKVERAPARAGSRDMWVGAEKRAFKSNKETAMKLRKKVERALK
jgi:hypothetical protein